MSIDSSGDQDTGLHRSSPTITRDRWTHHALLKLSKGYVLIASTTRKNANFHSPQKGYEMCAYDVARKLIADGAVVKTRAHHLGDVYELAEAAPLPPVPISVPDDDEDAELDSGLDAEMVSDADDVEDDEPLGAFDDDDDADPDEDDSLED